MQTKVRGGVVGAGWPGQQHARAIRASPDAILQALAEPNEERAGEFRPASADGLPTSSAPAAER
ncbi:MAG: hypothetical protein M3480_09775 [Verrucomicrobiota bacterium]|nr:hypothetical protein [Chthoniobacterales bacterium]MDQ3415236.1 hypothetical protein [Verrucomicrobiota bacterium]